jgi:uracil-DNA glycosylase
VPKGFFTDAELKTPRAVLPLLPQCGACGLFRKCHSPKIPVYGRGKKQILVVGEGPGENEDQRNRPFVGKAGKYLRDVLHKYDIDLDEDCFTTNSIRCRAATKAGKNRAPTGKEISHCRPYATQAIRELNPELIILLGGAAVHSVIGWLWKEDPGGILRWAGFRIPYRKLNTWICPCYHPSFVIREGEYENKGQEQVRRLYFDKQIRGAMGCTGRPYTEEEMARTEDIRICMNPDDAIPWLRLAIKENRHVAFDLETNKLKSDTSDANIHCCSVSNGASTVSFPWHGKVIKVLGELLDSNAPKIGYNLGFEEKWVRKVFGFGVRNWQWDGILAAHVLDNRRGITSLKFQAFAMLGEESWADAIKPYLEGEGGNGKNRIHEFPLEKTLLYCAKDSLYEFRLAQVQMKQLGAI